MSAELRRILEAHVAAGFAGETYFLRLSRGGNQPIARSTVDTWVEQDFKAARLPLGRGAGGLTFHSLRHTFASWLVQRDVQIMKVARLLGDTAKMVEDVYGHLLPGDLERVVDLLDVAAGMSGGEG
jgi:integrase